MTLSSPLLTLVPTSGALDKVKESAVKKALKKNTAEKKQSRKQLRKMSISKISTPEAVSTLFSSAKELRCKVKKKQLKQSPWPIETGSADAIVNKQHDLVDAITIKKKQPKWHWPSKTLFFISDPHADADAFEASLITTGGIIRDKSGQLKLTKQGKKSTFIVGGDCLDKGPSNLALLRKLKEVIDLGADLKLLAGNHDLRLLIGLLSIVGIRDTGNEHMFVRMGNKVVPLLKEVFDLYLADTDWQKDVPSESECKEKLFPSESWFSEFPKLAQGLVPEEGIDRELKKMRTKTHSFEKNCLKSGLSLPQVYATAQKCQELFLSKKGEFYWFFNNMQLAYQKGSFLFVHAGVDDTISELIAKKGVSHLNKCFRKQLHSNLFDFYYSSIANTFRTKYRKSDKPLTQAGVNTLRASGIHAVVRGHVNYHHGQQLNVKQGLLHIECDITLDRNSRIKEGLEGIGYGVTMIQPKGRIIGLSTDFDSAKVFQPKRYLKTVNDERIAKDKADKKAQKQHNKTIKTRMNHAI
ncbi:metallophosphoesterase family protein [Marinomonas sp. 2405UD68-3]|uniref:metallophosphoesterase family protein n=1 Tax=Marinomonas sp. 2405UD68-3 TaxID=3391835 RepID=UPI0039C917D3